MQIILNGRTSQKVPGSAGLGSQMMGTDRGLISSSGTPPNQLNSAAMQSSTAIRSLADVLSPIPPLPTPFRAHSPIFALKSHDSCRDIPASASILERNFLNSALACYGYLRVCLMCLAKDMIPRTVVQMRAALDTKELLLSRLTKMNEEIEAGMHKEEGGQRPAAFQKAYAQVLLDLQMVCFHQTQLLLIEHSCASCSYNDFYHRLPPSY